MSDLVAHTKQAIMESMAPVAAACGAITPHGHQMMEDAARAAIAAVLDELEHEARRAANIGAAYSTVSAIVSEFRARLSLDAPEDAA